MKPSDAPAVDAAPSSVSTISTSVLGLSLPADDVCCAARCGPDDVDDDFLASPASLSPASVHSSSSSSASSSSVASSGFPRVVYGAGTVAQLAKELGRLHLSSPLVVSSPSRIALSRRIQTLIPNLDSRILDSAFVGVPGSVVDDVLEGIADRDAVVSVGGASAVGLASAISCRAGIPHICIPTTYSGSEMMPPLLGASCARHLSRTSSSESTPSVCSSSSRRRHRHRHRHRHRRCSRLPPATQQHITSTVRDPRVPPAVVIYDEELTASSSRCFSAPSATVALARSTEARTPAAEDDVALWSYISLPGV
ncbi:hypothetical protein CDD80_5217 [Ophiocordyceps camponoti-rufipedis]|uniref:Alcohol dehydrogenase iron-type/glycerol dehydrogenase GldA domain-containing protein n=1 Tax=Ophiocordyceps camponoti-rufipedis TaxID=2004952 RepID=A0A2C5YX93_9HYPO|nr:hypothetical protein CDD80_5217 [Ophiocordyceps camponoti-rufipedis]